MQLMAPRVCSVDAVAGVLGNGSGRYRKTFGDLAGLYADGTAFARMAEHMHDAVVYEVTECRPSETAGDLIFGVTRMVPGTVGEEFFLTRGHIHATPDRPEIYCGQRGFGLMQMESPDGTVEIAEIGPGTICYVPPYWIHRSINAGTEDLVMTFCYPADSGQDYGIIARSGGMRVRIMSDGSGGWVQVPNPDYIPRPPHVVEALLRPTSPAPDPSQRSLA